MNQLFLDRNRLIGDRSNVVIKLEVWAWLLLGLDSLFGPVFLLLGLNFFFPYRVLIGARMLLVIDILI